MRQVLRHFFQHIYLLNWDICHIVSPTVVSLYRRNLPPEIGITVTLISASLSFWKRWRWPDRNLFRCKKIWTRIVNADLHALCFVFWCQLLWHPSGAQFSEQQVLRENFVQQGAGSDWWHSWRLISIGAMFYAFKNFIRDRTSQLLGAGIRASNFNHCNDATVKTR